MRRRKLLKATLGAGATGLVSSASSGCDSDSTTGSRVQLAIESETIGPSFVTDFGWAVELERAELATAGMQWVDGAPVGATASFTQRVARWLIPEAHAHPGHYAEGQVLAAMDRAERLDLLSSRSLASVDAITGDIRSAAIWFDDRAASAASIAGRASSPDGVMVAFEATITAEDLIESASGEARVEGCPVVGGPLAADATLRLEVDLGLWLARVPFEDLAASGTTTNPDIPVEFSPGSPAHTALVRGARKAGGYLFILNRS
ncbi:MAG: hypothetical protein AAGA56_11175 [Myxococcota bacterium]